VGVLDLLNQALDLLFVDLFLLDCPLKLVFNFLNMLVCPDLYLFNFIVFSLDCGLQRFYQFELLFRLGLGGFKHLEVLCLLDHLLLQALQLFLVTCNHGSVLLGLTLQGIFLSGEIR
jgi:hypothetical protein